MYMIPQEFLSQYYIMVAQHNKSMTFYKEKTVLYFQAQFKPSKFHVIAFSSSESIVKRSPLHLNSRNRING